MDNLKQAIQKVRSGGSTDFIPNTHESQSILVYCEASYLLHLGAISRFDELVKSRDWKCETIRNLLRIKRLLQTEERSCSLKKLTSFDLDHIYQTSLDLSSFWRIEVLSLAGFIAYRRGDFSSGVRFYRELKNLAKAEGATTKHSEALMNLGHHASYSGDSGALCGLIEETKREGTSCGSEEGAMIYDFLADELGASFAWVSCDLRTATRLSSSLLNDLGARDSILDRIHIFVHCHETLIAHGAFAAASEIEKELRSVVAGNRAQIWPTALREIGMSKSLRLFDGELQRVFLDMARYDDLPAYWLKGQVESAVFLAQHAYRHDSNFIEEATRSLDDIEDQMKWARAFRTRYKLARLALDLKRGEGQIPDAGLLIKDSRKLMSKGRATESRDIWFFAIEVMIASNESSAAFDELKSWIRSCRDNGFHFDAEVGGALLSRRTLDELPLDSCNSELAKFAAHQLLHQWPWTLVNEKHDPRQLEKCNMRKKKYEELIEILEKANHEPVDLETLVAELWAEEFDVFIHPNRLYQIAAEARQHLESLGFSKNSLRSYYGKGYLLTKFKKNQNGVLPQSRSIESFVYNRMAKNPSVEFRSQDIAREFNITARHARRTLALLEERGILTTRQQGASRYYRFTEKSKKAS